MLASHTDPFVLTVKPIFKQRKIWRIWTGLALLFLLLGLGSVLMLVSVPIFAIVYSKLLRINSSIEKHVWDKFEQQLDSINPAQYSTRQEPLSGVMGSLGGSQMLSTIAAGTLGSYNIRLLDQYVTFEPDSKNGSYSRIYRVLEIKTRQDFYHVFIDSKRNNESFYSTSMHILSRSVKTNSKLNVEGDVNKYFDIYIPKGNETNSLITLTPEKLLALRDYGTRFDVEFFGNSIYLISSNKIRSIDDILSYQKDAIQLVENIGIDLQRKREDTYDTLAVTTPIVFTIF